MGYFPTDIYDDATELRRDDIAGNIEKDDDNLVRQMWAETWKMSLYSNSPGKGDTVPILCGNIKQIYMMMPQNLRGMILPVT